MMKTLIASGAVLLVAGAASAADVQVVVDPDSNVIVRHVEWVPPTEPDFVAVDTDSGMLSADEVILDDDPVVDNDLEAIFGFDPEAVIYIRPDQPGSVHTFEID